MRSALKLVAAAAGLLLPWASFAQGTATDQSKLDPESRSIPANNAGPADPTLREARSLLQLGTLDKAEEMTRQYLRDHANSADGHFLLGFILFRKANAKASLAEFTEGAKYHAPSAFDLKVVGCDYVLLNDYMDADKWFTRSAEWDPKDVQSWYYLGRTKYNENRFEEAISAFKECLKLEPKNVKAEDNLGLSYAGLTRNEEARAAYLNAIAWQKESGIPDAGPFIDMGSLLFDENRVSESIPYLLQGVQIAPQEMRARRELGKAYLHANEPRKAQDELEKALELVPNDASLHYMLAQVYRKEGLSEKAKLEFDRYAAIAGTHSTRESPEP